MSIKKIGLFSKRSIWKEAVIVLRIYSSSRPVGCAHGFMMPPMWAQEHFVNRVRRCLNSPFMTSRRTLGS